ncbi:MAG TPA: hypothetical protein VH142_10775, partial [Polyangiaceae bacterium]|nr:hypothetical protein [Polyangiaceae bacterium]
MQGVPRNGYFASNPSQYSNSSASLGWGVDLTLTPDGKLSATLSAVGSQFVALGGMYGENGSGGAAGVSD